METGGIEQLLRANFEFIELYYKTIFAETVLCERNSIELEYANKCRKSNKRLQKSYSVNSVLNCMRKKANIKQTFSHKIKIYKK